MIAVTLSNNGVEIKDLPIPEITQAENIKLLVENLQVRLLNWANLSKILILVIK